MGTTIDLRVFELDLNGVRQIYSAYERADEDI